MCPLREFACRAFRHVAEMILVLVLFFAAGGPAMAQLSESASPAESVTHIKITAPPSPRVIPATLFGSFLEPIGDSIYNGLWAEILENPSFEAGLWSPDRVGNMLRLHPELQRASDLDLPLPWQPLDSTEGNRYLRIRGDAGNSFESLLLMALPDKEVGVLQEVYLPVQRELSYTGSLLVKHVRGPAEVTITLRRHAHPDQVLARAVIDAPNVHWSRFPFKLTLPAQAVAPLEPVDFVVSLANDARAQIDNVLLNPADAIDGMDPDVIALARDLETPVLRFGGNFTSAYNWRDGIGPQEKRVSMRNASWGIPEYNTFGTDEFLRFCELIHAQPQIALNLGTGTPSEAADWVLYVDEHWGNRSGGLLWELGNELWGTFQIGYPSEQRIAAVTLANSEAVRAVDPHARLIGTGGDEDRFHDWNAQQLSNPAGTFNFLSTHFVVNDRVQLPNASASFRTMAALALPWGLGPRMHQIQQQAAAAGQPNVRVAFTEWLMISPTHDGPNYSNLGGALFAGGFLNMLMRNSDAVAISDMTGILDFGGIWKKRAQVYASPAYWVLRTYSRAHPRFLLDLTSDSPTYSIEQGVTRLPEIHDVPYVDCAAAEPEDRTELLMACVNRNLSRPEKAEFDLSTLPIADGHATITTITGDNVLLENDETEPNRVVPRTETKELRTGQSFSYTFPNASVTLIQMRLE